MTSLKQGHEAVKQVSAVAEPAWHERCMDAAQGCRDNADVVCDPLVQCQTARRKFNAVIKAAHYAIADGMTAITVTNQKDAIAAVVKLAQLMMQIKSQLAEIRDVYDL